LKEATPEEIEESANEVTNDNIENDDVENE